MIDYSQWLLVKTICLIVLTTGLSIALIYAIITMHLMQKQLRRLDNIFNWFGSIFDHVKESLLGIKSSLGNFNEIASWAWQWYQQRLMEQEGTNTIKKTRKSTRE